jgi:phage shock protein PspC (stress-responsive transcriptional regulator)
MKRRMADAMIFGVCSGLSEHTTLDVAVIRFLFAIFTALGFGLPAIIYVVLAIVMKKDQ